MFISMFAHIRQSPSSVISLARTLIWYAYSVKGSGMPGQREGQPNP